MEEPLIVGAGLISVAIVLAMVVYMFGRLKLEQQKTLQMLLEKDEATRAEWAHLMGPRQRAESDFRRGVLMLVMGFAFTGFLMMAGGIAWILGFVPIVVGLAYLFFWKRNAGDS